MSTIGRAISPSELVPHLRSLLKRASVSISHHGLEQILINQRLKRIKVGICVSGGPDSMALAYLLRNMSSIEDIKLDPLAFIVDHKARDGSTDEALKVCGFLDKIGTLEETTCYINTDVSHRSTCADLDDDLARRR